MASIHAPALTRLGTDVHEWVPMMPIYSSGYNRTNSDSPPRRKRFFAGLLAVVVGAVGLLTPLAATQAVADSGPTGTTIRQANIFYAYVGAGETLSASFDQWAGSSGGVASTVIISRPGAAPVNCVIPVGATAGMGCDFNNLTAATPGIWSISYAPAGNVQGRYVTWEIDVRADGVDIPGRVWSEGLWLAQGSPDLPETDFPLYYQSVYGDQYRAMYFGFNGIDSYFAANAIGLREAPSCESYYQSAGGAPYSGSGTDCGPIYKIFFDEPAADLPASATRFDGATDWILNPIVEPELSNLAFTSGAGTTQAGTITFDVENFVGNMVIQIDANGNGLYDDPEDLTIPYASIDSNGSYAFDGVDGLGNVVPSGQEINVRAAIDRAGEIHFVNTDVESRSGGIQVESRRGPDAGNTTLYWDDTFINTQQAQRCSGLIGAVSALDGVDSAGGVHGWGFCPVKADSNPNDGVRGSYGDRRNIQEWTYRKVDVSIAVVVPARAPELVVAKSADPASGTEVLPGQVINYTLTFENIGHADGIVDYDDVIEGVLDDATLTTAPAASDDALTVSSVTDGRFTVDGTLTAGQAVTVTYSATVNANGERGDSILGNFVVPGGEVPPEGCLDGSTLCTEHPVPQLQIAKISDADQNTRVGDVVTYTVTATNVGGLAYTAINPAHLTDDLTDVLDDATYNSDASADRPGVIVENGLPKISWSGALGLGDTVTLTYTATVIAGGDGIARNFAYGDVPETPTPVCQPATEQGTDPETGIPCAVDEFEVPRLTVEKTADVTELPANGGTVTYEVTITNQGPGAYTASAPAVVTDDLSEVLDDADFGEILQPADGVIFDPATEILTWEGALGQGESVVVEYTVTYDSASGDNILYNVACIPVSETAPGAESCAPVRIPAAALNVTKSVDPASGTSVDAGQVLTYTLTFESTGETAAELNHVDNLADVLDDAELVPDSIASSNPALVTDLQGTDLRITGLIPAGETYTATYSVKVKAYADQENHILANVVQGPDGCDVGGCPQTSNPTRHFIVTKAASPIEGVNTGDIVEYTITVTNDSEGDYTNEDPAAVTDDMTDVLDDATYNGDAVAVELDGSTVPAPSFASPVLAWSGPLAAGKSVVITFTVTVTNLGDADLVNTAAPVCADGVICEPETPPVTILLPRVTPDKSSDPVTGSDVLPGETVTYMLTFTNDGQAAGAIDAKDNMSAVLDDADLTNGPATDHDGVSAVFEPESESIRVTGVLGAGEVVTVTYQVTVLADGERGDNILANVLVPDMPPYVCADGDDKCDPFVPPSTEHFVGELVDWKTVDPASGSTVQPGQVVTYTLHFENTGEAPMVVDREDVLTQVLDDATVTSAPVSSDAALTVSEITDGRFSVAGSLEPGQHVTVTYVVTVNDDGARGDDRLDNFLVNTGEEPPAECSPADDERPDCTVNHVSDVVVEKSSDPESGTDVSQGQNVTYTLTFRNVSTNTSAMDVAIDYTDHMVDVLDDATLKGDPAVSRESVTATVTKDAIRIVGAVPSGQTVTVSYTVAVKEWSQQGDHHLGNVVAVTGQDSICAPGSRLCTLHNTIEPVPLAITGTDLAWGAVATGFLLILSGGLVLTARSRRAKIEESVS